MKWFIISLLLMSASVVSFIFYPHYNMFLSVSVFVSLSHTHTLSFSFSLDESYKRFVSQFYYSFQSTNFCLCQSSLLCISHSFSLFLFSPLTRNVAMNALILYFILFWFFSFPLWFITEYWIWFPVLYSRTLFIYFIYGRLYLLVPNS